MTTSRTTGTENSDDLLSLLLKPEQAAVNDDMLSRAEVNSQETRWQPTRVAGLSIRVLEFLPGSHNRLTALLRLNPNAEAIELPSLGLELLVKHGVVSAEDTEYMHPFYMRSPNDPSSLSQSISLHHGGGLASSAIPNELEFYIATGQVPVADQQRRCINLADTNLWLPGPVEDTEVMPLHMHDGNNSMLVRWLKTSTFKPRLDPLGEEVLVLTGTLGDDKGSYPAGSWLRNPVESWQTWTGQAGTVIYYKNGHFAKS